MTSQKRKGPAGPAKQKPCTRCGGRRLVRCIREGKPCTRCGWVEGKSPQLNKFGWKVGDIRWLCHCGHAAAQGRHLAGCPFEHLPRGRE